MASDNWTAEAERLRSAFENEAGKFLPITLTIIHANQQGYSPRREFRRPNHVIPLWQYHGPISTPEAFVEDLKASGDFKWGVNGAQVSILALLEGDGALLFVRMGTRAGALLERLDMKHFRSTFREEILARGTSKNPKSKPIVVTNDNPLASWINYLLFYSSLTGRDPERSQRIDLDPFSLSLLALESLISTGKAQKADPERRILETAHFSVALSFPGEHRPYVSEVVENLRRHLPPDSIFYDEDFQAQLARPNLDVLLQRIYRHQTDLVVVFLCSQYEEKEWCGLEWRAIRELIKEKEDHRLFFVRLDESVVSGLFSIDGSVDARSTMPSRLAELIAERASTLREAAQRRNSTDA